MAGGVGPVRPTRRTAAGGPRPTRRTAMGAPPGPDQPTQITEWLPPELADRFEVVEPLPRTGGEADLLKVRERGHGQGGRGQGRGPGGRGPGGRRGRPGRRAAADVLVLKLYRPGADPDRGVWEVLRGVDRPELVRPIDTGTADGRSYELLDYVPGGNLADLLAEHPHGLPADSVIAILDQITKVLTELHDKDVVHRDIKPGNILLRSRGSGSEPPQVAVADFGVAVRVTQPLTPGVAQAGTIAYSPPEAFTSLVSVRADWWSLGITIAELLAGRHPLNERRGETAAVERLSDDAVAMHIVSRPIPIPEEITDPRLRLLCAGLITPDHAQRWTAEQITEWRAGHDPRVADTRIPLRSDHRPLSFNGQEHTEPGSLARALATNWRLAAARFFPATGSGWAELRSWLEQFDDPGRADSSMRLAERLETAWLPPDVGLLLLIRWLDPGLDPFYRELRLRRGDLAVLSRAYVTHLRSGDDAEAEPLQLVIDDLWDYELLPFLGEDPQFGAMDRSWREATERWLTLHARWHRDHPEIRPVLDRWQGTLVRAHLLWLVADPAAERLVRRWVREAAIRVRRTLRRGGRRLDWFDDVLGKAGDPAGMLLAFAVSAQAIAEADRINRWHAAGVAADARRVAVWNRRERWRDLDRPLALGWAAASIGIVVVCWSMLLSLGDALPVASTEAVTRAWIFMTITVTLQAGAELWLAGMIGAPYHPAYSLLFGIARPMEAVTGRLLGRGVAGAVVAMVVVAAVFSLAVLVPYLMPAIVLPPHLLWVRHRYGRWCNDHARRRARALRAGAGSRPERGSR